MKKSFTFFVSILILSFGQLFAQLKIGYVDSNTIIDKLPDAQDIQKRLETNIQEWREELNKMESDFKSQKEDFEARKLIMSKQKQTETEKELTELQKAIDDYRQKRFGVNGDLFKSQEELMKPIHNAIFKAIEDVAKENELDFVFDRSGDLIFLYAKDEYDITNQVLNKLTQGL